MSLKMIKSPGSASNDPDKKFLANFKHLQTADKLFAELWLDFADILASCSPEHLEHYILEMFKKTFFVLDLAVTLKDDPQLNQTRSTYIQKAFDEAQSSLPSIILEMKRKFTQLGKIMYKRKDIAYDRCIFEMSPPHIKITLKRSLKYLVVVDTNTVNSALRFNSNLGQFDNVTDMFISIPQNASVGFSHDAWLVTRTAQRIIDDKDDVVLKAVDRIEDTEESISKFQTQNGIGSRQIGTSKVKVYSKPGNHQKQLASCEFNSPQSMTNTTVDTFSSSSSAAGVSSGESANWTPTSSLNSAAQNEESTFDRTDQLTCAVSTPVVNHSDCDGNQTIKSPHKESYEFLNDINKNNTKYTSSFLAKCAIDDDDGDSEDLVKPIKNFQNDRKKDRYQKQKDARFFSSQAQVSSDDENSSDEHDEEDGSLGEDDFFCNDGEHEELHPMSAFQNQVVKARAPIKLKNGGGEDEEYATSSDEDIKRYKVQKAAQSESKLEKSTKKRKARKELKLKQKSARKSPDPSTSALASTRPDSQQFSVVLKNLTLKKRTHEDFKSNPAEDASVVLVNKLRFLPQQGTSIAMLEEPEVNKLESRNLNLDNQLVLFLVKHCTTRIGAEIALERCVIDYIFKKQALNSISKVQQQWIANWQEVFLNIEQLIMARIKNDRDNDYNVLERAHQRTKQLLHRNFLMRRTLIEENEDLASEEVVENRVEELKTKHTNSVQKLASIANKSKLFNEQSYRYSLRKVNSTLHQVCIKVCITWLEQNNGLDVLDDNLLRNYSNKAFNDKATIQQMENVTTNGFFVLGAEDMLELVEGASLPSSEELIAEQTQLQSILENDHLDNLVKTIESVNDDKQNVLNLINIVWAKEPRTKLSFAVQNKPRKTKASETEKKEPHQSASTALVSMSTPIATAVASSLSVAGNVLPTTFTAHEMQSAAAGSQKITSFYSGVDQPALSADEGTSVATKPSELKLKDFHLNKFVDPTTSLTKIAMTFDSALCLITRVLRMISPTQCLQLSVKSSHKPNNILLRLKLLFFLFNERQKSSDEILRLFRSSPLYDMFDCTLLLKTSNLNSVNTKGDGYCHVRGQQQLKYREEQDFAIGVKEMRDLDEKCNCADLNNKNSQFHTFVADLPSMLKSELDNRSLIAAIGDLKWFTYKKKLAMLDSLLTLRPPGQPVAELLWGDAQTVTMLGFNVTAVSRLIDDDFMTMVPTERGKWVKYDASSVPVARTLDSWKRSNVSLSDLDQVVSQHLNMLVYRKPHFYVCDNPTPPEKVAFAFNGLLLDCVGQLAKRVALLETITPDFGVQLKSIIDNCESRSDVADYDYFDFQTFQSVFSKKFPDAMESPQVMVDFSQDDEPEGDSKETYLLKQALELSNAKLKVMEDYNNVLHREISEMVKK